MTRNQPECFGWRPDIPDVRDYSLDYERQIGVLVGFDLEHRSLPSRTDLRPYFNALNETAIDSLHAMADGIVSLYSYFEYRTLGIRSFPCPRFLARCAERLARGRSGTEPSFRDLFRAMRRCGIPPRTCTHLLDDQTQWWLDPLLYMFREDYQQVKYLRVDAGRNTSAIETLNSIRQLLSIGMPMVFGFSCSGIVRMEGMIEYRPTYEGVRGGLASLVVGYDDNRYTSCKGALLVRMPLGEQWGELGYGWLPYDFILTNMAIDFWTMFKPEWMASGELQKELDILV